MVTVAPKVSLPVNAASMVAPAAVKVEWPDTYSGKAGVTTFDAW